MLLLSCVHRWEPGRSRLLGTPLTPPQGPWDLQAEIGQDPCPGSQPVLASVGESGELNIWDTTQRDPCCPSFPIVCPISEI